jgi:hypothetical protein
MAVMRTRPVIGSMYGSMARSNACRKAEAEIPLVVGETGRGEHALDDAGVREPDRYRRGVILRWQEAADRLEVRQVVAANLPEHHAQPTTRTQDARSLDQRGFGAVHESVEASYHVEARVGKRQLCHITLMEHSVRAPFGGDPQQVRGGINTGHVGAAGVRSL